MSIRIEYFDYLSHFEDTVTLAEYASSAEPEIALRHDVDHCIDTALEMAFWETENNIKASYFILGTAPYRDDSRLMEKCLQIQEFGHEVGIHINSITKWFDTGCDPYEDFKQQIKGFTDAGIKICGISAHGDRACYEHNFINYWLFRELKTDDVVDRESSLNAEGIFEPDECKRIQYPDKHLLKRSDGLALDLWSMNGKDLGLTYEASHLISDIYFTDSGGLWKRSSDPMKEDLRGKRVQVLMHPIHWRAPRKIYFFLSTARSGSKWLATILDQASSCTGRHEYTLNHINGSEDGEIIEEKMTGDRLHELLEHENKIEEGLEHTRQLVDSEDRDYAEVNVYLPLVIDQLINKFPDAQLIHLHRNPADVVRSIMNRGWYDTPHDTAHPSNLYDGWNQFSPFQKSCCYVRFVTECLIERCKERIVFEKMTTDPQYLKERLKDLGIAYYPLLSRAFIDSRVNANKLKYFPDYKEWESTNKLTYEEQLTKVNNNLGYMMKNLTVYNHILSWFRLKKHFFKYLNQKYIKSQDIFKLTLTTGNIDKYFSNNINIINEQSFITINAIEPDAHAYLLFHGGVWSKLHKKSGWKIRQGGYYNVVLASIIPLGVKANLMCLYYDKDRTLIHKRNLGTLSEGEGEKQFAFAMMGNSSYFNLALYLPKQEQNRSASIISINMEFRDY